MLISCKNHFASVLKYSHYWNKLIQWWFGMRFIKTPIETIFNFFFQKCWIGNEIHNKFQLLPLLKHNHRWNKYCPMNVGDVVCPSVWLSVYLLHGLCLCVRLTVFCLLFFLCVTLSLITTETNYFNRSSGVFHYENHFPTTIEIQVQLKYFFDSGWVCISLRPILK